MVFKRRGTHRRRSATAKLDATPPVWQTEHDIPATVPTTGPYDLADLPDDDVARIDLGALRVPNLPGISVQCNVASDQRVVSATFSHQGSQLQVSVCAAPRTASIWDEIRQDLAKSVVGQGGSSEELEGTFGTELLVRVPAQGGQQWGRYIGVDGPRWHVQGLFGGAAARDRERAAALEDAFRKIVVVRGTEPKPVKERLTLQLPEEIKKRRDAERLASLDGNSIEPD